MQVDRTFLKVHTTNLVKVTRIGEVLCRKRSPTLRKLYFKVTLMQIWKSPYMFCSWRKPYPENFSLLILWILEFFVRKVWKFLISFTYLTCIYLKTQKLFLMWNLRHTRKILEDIQVCIIVPLRFAIKIVLLKHVALIMRIVNIIINIDNIRKERSNEDPIVKLNKILK